MRQVSLEEFESRQTRQAQHPSAVTLRLSVQVSGAL